MAKFTFVFVEMGQGDCTLVKCPDGKIVVVDCGFTANPWGDPNALMMGGMVMVGGLIQNKSPVTIDQVTPVARLTSEYEVIVVPASGPKTLKELLDKFKANPGSVSWGGGSAGGGSAEHLAPASVVGRAARGPEQRSGRPADRRGRSSGWRGRGCRTGWVVGRACRGCCRGEARGRAA